MCLGPNLHGGARGGPGEPSRHPFGPARCASIVAGKWQRAPYDLGRAAQAALPLSAHCGTRVRAGRGHLLQRSVHSRRPGAEARMASRSMAGRRFRKARPGLDAPTECAETASRHDPDSPDRSSADRPGRTSADGTGGMLSIGTEKFPFLVIEKFPLRAWGRSPRLGAGVLVSVELW